PIIAQGAGRGEGGDKYDTAATPENGQELLHKEIWGANVDRELMVEVLDGRVFDRRRLEDPRIGHEDIEPFANKIANPGSERMCTLGIGEIHSDGICMATVSANLISNRFRFISAVAVV